MKKLVIRKSNPYILNVSKRPFARFCINYYSNNTELLQPIKGEFS